MELLLMGLELGVEERLVGCRRRRIDDDEKYKNVLFFFFFFEMF